MEMLLFLWPQEQPSAMESAQPKGQNVCLGRWAKAWGGPCRPNCAVPTFSISVRALSSPPHFPESLMHGPQPLPVGAPPHSRSQETSALSRRGGPGSGTHLACLDPLSLSLLQVLELRRPMDSRLEHVDFECLFTCLSVRQLIRIFASLLLERRVIFVADKLR